MSNNKQSSIEWFFSELERMQYFIGNDMLKALKQAKAMHKEEIEATYADGYAQGYKLALELVQCSISNLIPNNDESNN